MTSNKSNITISLDKDLLQKIEKKRKDVPRSRYINNILKDLIILQGGKKR